MSIRFDARRKISVYVSRDKNANPLNRDAWALYANYPNEVEANSAIVRALTENDYKSARLVIETLVTMI